MKLAIDDALSALDEGERERLLRRGPAGTDADLRETVAAIITRVREEGDDALLALARELDGVELGSLEVPRERWEAALDDLPEGVLPALERAVANLETFHATQIPPSGEVEVEDGIVLGRRPEPLAVAGAYAPGGTAAYPSTVLMCVVPARVAGVDEVVVCSPPDATGEPTAAVRAACALAGADRLFSLGGAGAIAALAHGTRSVPRADVIVGPGNRYVAEAKRQVAGTARIDSPAGPSELLVIADGSADPRLVAIELLAQAEHDVDAAAVLVTPSERLADEVRDALDAESGKLGREEIAREALSRQGGILRVGDEEEALAFAAAYAPEHLLLLARTGEELVRRVRNAGTVFVGPGSSVAFGDYMTGANHVLPTGGAARSFSGLSALDFVRIATWQRVGVEAARGMAEPVALLAEAEGLPAHAAAARARNALTREGRIS